MKYLQNKTIFSSTKTYSIIIVIMFFSNALFLIAYSLSTASGSNASVSMAQAGVSVQQVTTTTDIGIPSSTDTGEATKIPAGRNGDWHYGSERLKTTT